MKQEKLKQLFMLCLSLSISIGASAEEYSGTCGANAQWSLNTTTGLLSITGSGNMTDYDDHWDLYAPWYNYRDDIKSVSIGNQITSIGNCAFYSCSGLTSVTIPNSVTVIYGRAFEGCWNLTSVTIPNSVTDIGNDAFNGCFSLTSIVIPSSVTSIEYGTFYDCKGLTSVTIPNSVTSIGYDAFRNCTGLTSLTIGNSVTEIGESAFEYCYRLTNVTIPNSVMSIGDRAFSDCEGLTSVTIPNSVISVGNDAFSGCSSLPVVDNIRYADTYLVGAVDKTLTTYNIKVGTKWIGSSAFSGCSGLTSVTIPNSVTEIGNYAFEDCSGLTSVTIPNSVTSIGLSAFEGCDNVKELIYAEGTKTVLQTGLTSITSVTIPNSVTSIGYSAFSGCSGLTSVTIPNSVTEIGNYAFEDCSGLTSVTIPNSVTSISGNAFRGCSSLPVTDNIRYADTYLVEAVDKTLTTYNIKEGTKWIGSSAFYNCSGLTSVTIPNSVTSIGSSAFSGCSGLRSVYVKWNESSKIPSITNTTFPFSACNLYVPCGTTSIYKSKNYWKNFKSIIEPSGQNVTISAAKYGTFGSRYAAKIPSGVSAYTATVDGSTVTMTKIQDGVIPGDCGVILYAAQGDYTFAPNAEVEQVEDNQLVAVTENTYTCKGDDVGKVYYLGLDNGGKATFVCLNSNGTIPVGKAYLKLDAALDAGAKLDVVFGDEPTGIEEVQGSRFKVQGSVYNLNGVRVNKDYKGIIIVNGKKYMNK